jgi:uncharacterized YccA/Bax inhibitor family protein
MNGPSGPNQRGSALSRDSRIVNPNPVLARAFDKAADDRIKPMTLIGTIHKTALLLTALVAAAVPGWMMVTTGAGVGLLFVALFGGFVVGLITAFQPRLAPRTAWMYALLEGFVIGGVSHVFEDRYNGIVVMAAGVTVSIFAVLLLIYRTGVIKVTRNFRLGVAAATGGVLLLYLADLAIQMFGGSGIPLMWAHSTAGIVVSLIIIGIAAANLVVDFDFIEDGAARGAPAYMEWYGAFGLLVTLVWLYIEILRLLSKLRK